MKTLLSVACFLVAFSPVFSTPAPGSSSSGCEALAAQPAFEINILFAYTTSAALAADGAKNIKRNVDEGLYRLNEVLKNNAISCTVKALDQYAEVDYGAATSQADVEILLAELRKPDGKFNKVHQFRQQKQADLVCLIFSGFSMGKADLGGEFFVCHFSEGIFGESYVFPHEFGHIMGATHEAGMRIDFDESSYRTVSATGGLAIPYYSDNKTITLNLNGMNRTFPIGDATHNNAETIRQNVPAKSKLGNSLPAVPDASNAATARLVDPQTAPLPNGGTPVCQIKWFDVAQADATITIRYQCSDAVDIMVIGYDNTGAQFGSFTTKLDPSRQEMNLRHWADTMPGDKFVLKIKGEQLATCTIN